MFYWVILTILTLIAVLIYKTRLGALLIFVSLLFFSMCRGDSVGTDTQNYIDATSAPVQFDIEKTATYEVTFVSICNLIHDTNLPGRTIIVFLSLYTFLFLYITCRKLNINLCLACLFFYLLFYISSLNEARQIAACMSVFAGYAYYLKDKDIFRFILLVILSASLHLSSLLFLFVPFLLQLHDKFNKTVWITVMLVSLIAFRICDIDVFSRALSMLLDFDIKYVSSYSDLFDEVSGGFSIFAIISFFIEFIIIVYLLITNNPDKDKLTQFEFLFVLGFLFLCIMSPAHMYIKRISYGLSLFSFLFYANYYQRRLNFRKLTMTNCVFICHVILYVYILFSKILSNSNGVLPYVWA